MRQPRNLPPVLADRFFAYTTADHQCLAMEATAAADSGIVVRDSAPLAAVRLAQSVGYKLPVVIDVGSWRTQVATRFSPTVLDATGAMWQISLDSWASDLLTAGASAVLTPSKFVRLGDWASLRAVLDAGESATLPEVVTLVATDAAMLDYPYLARFNRVLSTASRPLALIFAAKDPPLKPRGRAAGLRQVVSHAPGCFLLATEPLSAFDAWSHGASAAGIGITGGLRRPRRPGDQGGGNAKDFVPGLFLRDLWEHRSPGIYADWYANSPSPRCRACGGRALDAFGSDETDKAAVLRHSVHTWLAVFADLTGDDEVARRRRLADEWVGALAAHLGLRPAAGWLEADSVLRQLVELDDPQGRRTTREGAWR